MTGAPPYENPQSSFPRFNRERDPGRFSCSRRSPRKQQPIASRGVTGTLVGSVILFRVQFSLRRRPNDRAVTTVLLDGRAFDALVLPSATDFQFGRKCSDCSPPIYASNVHWGDWQ